MENVPFESFLNIGVSLINPMHNLCVPEPNKHIVKEHIVNKEFINDIVNDIIESIETRVNIVSLELQKDNTPNNQFSNKQCCVIS